MIEAAQYVSPESLAVNPKFRAVIPPLSPEEFFQLEANLKTDGCRDPLVAWRQNGHKPVVLDGHNRFTICSTHSIPFKTVEMRFPDEDAAMVWIIRNQFGRRNLTPFTRAELALKLEPLLRPAAKEKQKEGGRAKVCQNSDKAPIDTKKEIARAAHVSHDTIAKAKVIQAKASEETKAALRAGETSINAEYRKLTVHVGQNSGENEWYTPEKFIKAAKTAMGSIDCDPASSETANKTVKAEKFFTKDDDGLKQKWNGNVWMNPPYAQPLMGQFADAVAEKYDAGEIKQACVLVNNATETSWFARIAKSASAICFPSSRIKFLDPSGQASGAPLQGQAIIYLGKNRDAFTRAFAGFGITCHVLHG